MLYEVTWPSTVSSPQGLPSVPKLMELAEKARGTALPELAWRCIRLILAQLEDIHARIGQVEREIMTWHRTNELSQRLETILGIGITASALAATIPDPSSFRAGRHLSAWIGLVPRQSGTGGKVRLGQISQQGDRYLRRLLVLGATTLLRHARSRTAVTAEWITSVALTPCNWKTFFAKSKPIVLTFPMDASLKWCSSTPPLWHTKAVGGRPHGVIAGAGRPEPAVTLMEAGGCSPIGWKYGLTTGSRAQAE